MLLLILGCCSCLVSCIINLAEEIYLDEDALVLAVQILLVSWRDAVLIHVHYFLYCQSEIVETHLALPHIVLIDQVLVGFVARREEVCRLYMCLLVILFFDKLKRFPEVLEDLMGVLQLTNCGVVSLGFDGIQKVVGLIVFVDNPGEVINPQTENCSRLDDALDARDVPALVEDVLEAEDLALACDHDAEASCLNLFTLTQSVVMV